MDIATRWRSPAPADKLQGSNYMQVRMVKQPSGFMDGVSLKSYRVGRCYDLPATLAGYLVVEGFAVIEMRKDAGHLNRIRERRKTFRKA